MRKEIEPRRSQIEHRKTGILKVYEFSNFPKLSSI